MSNKIQLQTNNTELSSLIEVLRGKAVGGEGHQVAIGEVESNSIGIQININDIGFEPKVLVLIPAAEKNIESGTTYSDIPICYLIGNFNENNYNTEIVANFTKTETSGISINETYELEIYDGIIDIIPTLTYGNLLDKYIYIAIN